jgi:endoglucanase
MKKILPALIFLCSVSFLHAQTAAHNRCQNFQKGVNLSNWLEAYWQGNWPSPNGYSKQFLINMKAAGIKSVRLPIGFASVTDTLAPYNVDTTHVLFSIIDSVIQWTNELNMNLIIDNHHQWVLTDATWRNSIPRLSHMWAVLAQRYNYLDPEKYFFEILNEPSGIENDSVNILFKPVIDSIRQYAPNHSIVVSPTAWSGGIGYIGYQPLPDTNLIYTFHSYDPFPFTHQGFSWASPYYPPGITFPNSGYDFMIKLAWDVAIQWRDSFHLPLFLGEFGVGVHPDDISRCNWIDTVGARIDYYGVSSFHWDVRWDFKLFNGDVISEDSVIPCFKHALHLYGDTLTSVATVQQEMATEIFPNPARNEFLVRCYQFNLQKTELEIFDETGRKIIATVPESATVNFQTTEWAAGIYLLKIKTETSSAIRKIIIE